MKNLPTIEELHALQELEKAATPAPWGNCQFDCDDPECKLISIDIRNDVDGPDADLAVSLRLHARELIESAIKGHDERIYLHQQLHAQNCTMGTDPQKCDDDKPCTWHQLRSVKAEKTV